MQWAALNGREATSLIAVGRVGCHTEVDRMESTELTEVMGCVNAEDRDRVVEDSGHVVDYATVGVPCGGTGTVVEERERKEVEMYMKQSALNMRDTMKARREVGMWMKQACLQMKETTTGVDQARSGIDCCGGKGCALTIMAPAFTRFDDTW
jgi:hypothetical protein